MFNSVHTVRVPEFAESVHWKETCQGIWACCLRSLSALIVDGGGRLVVKATNKKLSVKEVAIIAEAANIKE